MTSKTKTTVERMKNNPDKRRCLECGGAATIKYAYVRTTRSETIEGYAYYCEDCADGLGLLKRVS